MRRAFRRRRKHVGWMAYAISGPHGPAEEQCFPNAAKQTDLEVEREHPNRRDGEAARK